jgi:hypothetical protein
MKFDQLKIEDVDETEEAIFQCHQLNRIREFLLANEASQDLIDAIDEAIEDIESWISPEIAFGNGTLQSGNS